MFSRKSKKSTTSDGTGYGGDPAADTSKLLAGRKRAIAKGHKQDAATMEYLSNILREIRNDEGAVHWMIPPSQQQHQRNPHSQSLGKKKCIRENIHKLIDTLRMTFRNQVPAEWGNENNPSSLALRTALDICQELIHRCNQHLGRAEVSLFFGNPESSESLLYSLREISSEADLIAKRENSNQYQPQQASADSSLPLAKQILKIRRVAERLVRKKSQQRKATASHGTGSHGCVDNNNDSDIDGDDDMFVMSEKDIYTRALGPLRFDMVPALYHHSFGKIASSLDARAVFKELAAYKTALPVEYGGSIFVRAVHDRLDLLRALVIGPDDTPYANGCFIFDIHLPSQYPAVPPKVQLMTTGGGTVRFNPNLYDCGKVCLSLLGTWSGPGWVNGESTLLQVLVSIQSLILVPDPYYNEPGYERSRNTKAGEQNSLAYNKSKRGHTIDLCIKPFLQYALGSHQCPYPEFKVIITQHFLHKRRIIQQQLREWKNDDSSLDAKSITIGNLVTQLKERASRIQKEEEVKRRANAKVIELLDTTAGGGAVTTKKNETIILDLDDEIEIDSKPSASKRARVVNNLVDDVVELLDD